MKIIRRSKNASVLFKIFTITVMLLLPLVSYTVTSAEIMEENAIPIINAEAVFDDPELKVDPETIINDDENLVEAEEPEINLQITGDEKQLEDEDIDPDPSIDETSTIEAENRIDLEGISNPAASKEETNVDSDAAPISPINDGHPIESDDNQDTNQQHGDEESTGDAIDEKSSEDGSGESDPDGTIIILEEGDDYPSSVSEGLAEELEGESDDSNPEQPSFIDGTSISPGFSGSTQTTTSGIPSDIYGIERESPDPGTNPPPVAVITATPTQVCVDENITFDGSESYDPGRSSGSSGSGYRLLSGSITIGATAQLFVDSDSASAGCLLYDYQDSLGSIGGSSGDSDSGGYIVSYEWDFGDGSNPTTTEDSAIIYNYPSSDSYTVKLTVTDNEGATDQDEIIVLVEDNNPIYPPYADAGGPYFTFLGSPTNFDGTNSTDTDGIIMSYTWEFGDGNTGTGSTVEHTYSEVGIYDVTLTVTDDDGATDNDTATVHVCEINRPPIADAGGQYFGYANEEIEFDGSNSTDVDGTIVNYTWNFGDGTYGSGECLTHAYTEEGAYTVSLKVTDNDGANNTDEVDVVIVINGRPSKPELTYTPGDSGYMFTVSSVDPNGDNICYLFNFDDNEGETVTPYFPSEVALTKLKTWDEDGTYVVTVRAKDVTGLISETTEVIITVSNVGTVVSGSAQTPGDEFPFKMVATIVVVMAIISIIAYIYKKRKSDITGFSI